MQTIHWHIEDTIGYLTLIGKPYNYTSRLFFSELGQWIGANATQPNLAGVIIQSSGRHFSAGADLPELRTMLKSEGAENLGRNLETLLRISCLPVPVVALMRGVCIGSGLELALFCHYRIAAPNLLASLPEVSFGLMPGAGGLVNCYRSTGMYSTLKLALTGGTIDANEALRIGLVHEICPPEEMLITAKKHLLGEN